MPTSVLNVAILLLNVLPTAKVSILIGSSEPLVLERDTLSREPRDTLVLLPTDRGLDSAAHPTCNTAGIETTCTLCIVVISTKERISALPTGSSLATTPFAPMATTLHVKAQLLLEHQTGHLDAFWAVKRGIRLRIVL